MMWPHDPEVHPPGSRPAKGPDPRRRQRVVRRAWVRRGVDRGHRERGRRDARAGPSLLRRTQGGLPGPGRQARQRPGGTAATAQGRSSRARVADSVSRWLDWTEANRTIWLATMAPGEDVGDPDMARVVGDLVRRAVVLLARFHADIAEDSPRLRHALECWTGLNRAATRRWLRGEATREATQELLASTLEHVLRTFGTLPDAPELRPARHRRARCG